MKRPAKDGTSRGRESKLTPAVQRALCKAIRETKIPIRDAARAMEISDASVFLWIKNGRDEEARAKLAGDEPTGLYYEFLVAVTAARAQGSAILLQRLADAAKSPTHWQAAAHLLAVTEPHLAPKVQIEVGRQLTEAISRLRDRFKDRPQILEEILETMAGDLAQETSDV